MDRLEGPGLAAIKGEEVSPGVLDRLGTGHRHSGHSQIVFRGTATGRIFALGATRFQMSLKPIQIDPLDPVEAGIHSVDLLAYRDSLLVLDLGFLLLLLLADQ